MKAAQLAAPHAYGSTRVNTASAAIGGAAPVEASAGVDAAASIISAAARVDASGGVNTAPIPSPATGDNCPAVINASAGASDGRPSDGAIGNVKGKRIACYDASVRRGGRCASRSSYGDRHRGQRRQDNTSHETFLLFECHLLSSARASLGAETGKHKLHAGGTVLYLRPAQC